MTGLYMMKNTMPGGVVFLIVLWNGFGLSHPDIFVSGDYDN